MKRLLLGLVFALSFAMSWADAGNYLRIKTSEGWQVLDLDVVDRLSFDGTTMKATDEKGQTVAEIPQRNLERMDVSQEAGVKNVLTERANATFSYNTSTQKATMLADGVFELFGADGTRYISFKALKGETVDLSSIAPGIVIIKSGDYSIKAIVK